MPVKLTIILWSYDFLSDLCGGSGGRLWPLSRKSYPKQFLELTGDGSLYQQSATRVTCETCDPIIVTNDNSRFIVRKQLQEFGIEDADVIIEPEGKNTALTILVAALHAASMDPWASRLWCPPTTTYLSKMPSFRWSRMRLKIFKTSK